MGFREEILTDARITEMDVLLLRQYSFAVRPCVAVLASEKEGQTGKERERNMKVRKAIRRCLAESRGSEFIDAR